MGEVVESSLFYFLLLLSMNLLVKPLTGILGLVLTIVGVAGFFVSGSLLGFMVDTTHNIIHLLSGLVALWAFNTSQSYSRIYLIIFGLVYALVTVLGFAMNGDILGLFTVNTADNFLHLAIAAASLIVGFGSRD